MCLEADREQRRAEKQTGEHRQGQTRSPEPEQDARHRRPDQDHRAVDRSRDDVRGDELVG
jgi:hypothetical protein